MTEYLKKDTIKQFRGEVVPHEVPELGGTLPLRAIGFRDIMEVQEIEDDVERALAFIRLGIVDPETGEPMFDGDEFIEVVNHWSTPIIQGLANKLKELSGADQETRETIEGNSSETTKGGLPIS